MVLNPLCARQDDAFLPCHPELVSGPFSDKERRTELPGLTKLLLIMNLTAIFLFVVCLTAGAHGYTQVTISQKNTTLPKLFKELKKQTGYNFIYSTELLNSAGKVSVDVKNVSLEDALAQCLKGKGLDYSIIEKTVVIKPAPTLSEVEGPLTTPHSRLTIDVSGKVTDTDGKPLEGATVTVKGTNIATKTDAGGVFILKAIDEDATLEITYSEYETVILKVNKRSTVTIALKHEVGKLGEVIINKGYYTEKQKYSVSNVGRVTAKDIEKQPVSNPLLALQGRVSGLVVTQMTGIPGGEVNVQIQGKNSIQNGNEPLYVVDGVPFSSKMLPTSTLIFGGSGSAFNYINPADIESIEILKDADATAIYGSRGANGAILITTKRGKLGKTSVDISLQQGWGKVSRKVDMLNTQQFVELRKEAKRNDNAIIGPSDYDINGIWDTTKYTNWQKEIIGGTSKFSNLQASISAGNSELQYLVGFGYTRESSVFTDKFADTKGSLHFNVNNLSQNKKFQVHFSGNVIKGLNKLPNVDLTRDAINLAPNAPNLYNQDGSLNWALLPSGTSTFNNPLTKLFQQYQNNTTNLLGNLTMSYQLASIIKIKSNFGYNSLISKEKSIIPITSFAPNSTFKERSATYSDKSNTGWIIEPQVELVKHFSIGDINFLVGSSFQDNKSELLAMRGAGFNSDVELNNIKAASTITLQNSIQSKYKYAALFARFNYNYQNKYILNLTCRRDGSSRFGTESRFHNFYSAGAAWTIFDDKLNTKKKTWLNFGKLRFSYGTTGNDQIGDYSYLSLYSPVTTLITAPYQGITAIGPTGFANPFLQWEETKKTSVGLDLVFFSNALKLNANFYSNVSSNQLLSSPLPIQTGFGNVSINFPATVRNSGFEFELQARAGAGKSALNWNGSFTLTIPKNKLVSFPGLASNSRYSNSLVIGKPITITKVFQFAGVDPQTGIYTFMNAKGELTTNPNSVFDKIAYVNTAPKFYGGWQNSITYKNLSIDIFFQYNKQLGLNSFFRFGNPVLGSTLNQPVSAGLVRWKGPGDKTWVQRASSNLSLFTPSFNATTSDAAYSDISFFSLKNASISYNLPSKILSKIYLTHANVFVQGQNLIIVSRFKGLNPENSGNAISLPPLRMITTGIRFTF